MGGIGGGSEGDLEGAHIECRGDCEDMDRVTLSGGECCACCLTGDPCYVTD